MNRGLFAASVCVNPIQMSPPPPFTNVTIGRAGDEEPQHIASQSRYTGMVVIDSSVGPYNYWNSRIARARVPSPIFCLQHASAFV